VIIGSPDAVLWRYLELKEKLGAPAGRNAIAERGLVFGDRCASCAGTVFHEEHSERTKAIRYVCSGCEASWPVDVAFLLRNEFQSSRHGDIGGDLRALMADYGAILSKLQLREKRIYLLLYLYENVGCYESVAKEATKRWPRSIPPWGGRGPRPGGWTEWGVRRVVTDARRAINDELQARGMKGAPA
jgi:hypothetical protein